MSAHDRVLFKKRVMRSILHTDMAHMKGLREDLQTHLDKFAIKDGENTDKFIDRSSVESEEESKQLLCSTLLHAADISTSVRDFDVSQMWADHLFQEFFH